MNLKECVFSFFLISLLDCFFEFQVDLLGDKVENLQRLLEKIYIALDHYSLILKHYPGVRCSSLLPPTLL